MRSAAQQTSLEHSGCVGRRGRSDVAVCLNFRHLIDLITGSPSLSSIDLLLTPICFRRLSSSSICILFPVDSHQKPANHSPTKRVQSCQYISNKTSGNHIYASETHDRDSANYRLGQEISGLFLGSMPPPKPFKKFLPISQNFPELPDSKGAFAGVSSAEKEVDMYPPFVSTVLHFCTHCGSSTFDR